MKDGELTVLQAKLNRGGYTTLAQVEGDQKRLVNNAKAYNDKKSVIYEDAERLRKTASNWMVKHNPAYRVNGYQAVATPVPGEDPVPYGKPIPRIQPSTPKPSVSTPDSSERPRRAAAAQSATPAPSKLRKSVSTAPEDADDGPDFKGKTFTQAQDQIIRELMDYIEPEYVDPLPSGTDDANCRQERSSDISPIPPTTQSLAERLLCCHQRSSLTQCCAEKSPWRRWPQRANGSNRVEKLGRVRKDDYHDLEECTRVQ